MPLSPTIPSWQKPVLILLAISNLPYLYTTITWWLSNDLLMIAFSAFMLPVTSLCLHLRRQDRRWRDLHAEGERLKAATQNWRFWGLLLPACALPWLGLVLEQPILGSTGLLLGLWSALWMLGGEPLARKYSWPLSPLFLTAPLTYGWPALLEKALQHLSARLASGWLTLLGTEVTRIGTELHTPTLINVVDETCSGINTLSALLVYCLVLGLIMGARNRQMAIAMVTAVVIVPIFNGARIAYISFLGERGGIEAASGPMHHISGLVAFGGAYALLLLVSWVTTREARTIDTLSATAPESPAMQSDQAPQPDRR